MPSTPQSPPARRTRSRAKAVEETKVTKISTPGAKAASRNTKRTNTVENVESETVSGLQRDPIEQEMVEPPNATVKKAIMKPSTATSKAPARAASNDAAAVETRSRSTRGRPRKNQDAENTIEQPHPTTRATRAKTVTSTTAANKKPATKKKVTFEEHGESDKENAMEVDNIPKGGPKGTKASEGNGIKARPVRKTATKKTTAASETRKTQGKGEKREVARGEPLSPKKETQVAKAKTDEDNVLHEPNSAQTPSKQLQKSPLKLDPRSVKDRPNKQAAQEPKELTSSIDELQQPTEVPGSPTKTFGASLSASPARRLPLSPFKEAVKTSPKRLATISDNTGQNTSIEDSYTNLLSKSPRKIALGDSQLLPVFEPPSSALKTSTLKSPARKPPSPMKAPMFARSPERSQPLAAGLNSTIATGVSGSPRKFISPEKTIRSPLKAEKAVSALPKVYTMTPGEQARMLEDELVFGPSPFSPSRKFDTAGKVSAALKHRSQVGNTPKSSKKSRIPVRSPPQSPPTSRDGKVAGEATPARVEGSTNKDSAMEKPFAWLAPQNELILEDDSEDELQTTDPKYNTSPSPQRKKPLDFAATPTPALSFGEVPTMSMTALAEKFSNWEGASPDKRVVEQRNIERQIFSPLVPNTSIIQDQTMEPEIFSSPPQRSHFDEAMDIREDPQDEIMQDQSEVQIDDEVFAKSQISDASQDYGDENEIPIDPMLNDTNIMQTETCTPAKVFSKQATVIHTVSKVPLKAADDADSQTLKPSKRSKSLAQPLSPHGDLELQLLRQINPPASTTEPITGSFDGPIISKFSEMLDDEFIPEVSTEYVPATPTPKSGSWSVSATPARTPRPDLNTKLLNGAVVFVDVHTTEGADASGIFVELLGQMGAKCVKSWNWNSRASMTGENSDDTTGVNTCSKVGITHVVFKDGGKRTMEKVREARGLVLCVGVGWVLDCERQNRWLDEADYAIDISTIPRGGHRRRKSMEPKLLASSGGNLFNPISPIKEQLSPTKEFLNLSSPVSRRQTISLPSPERLEPAVEIPRAEDSLTPPKRQLDDHDQTQTTPYKGLESTFGSPATPYFLDPHKLTQQTCPPKQSQELLFPLSGRIEDQPSESIRQRLLAARRKSLQWAPKVGSPLAKESDEYF